MGAKNKRNILIIAAMSIVVIFTLLGFISFSYVRNYADLPTAFNSLTSYGGPFFAFNTNKAQITSNTTVTALPVEDGERMNCPNYFDITDPDLNGNSFITGFDPYMVYNSYHFSTDEVKDIYRNYKVANNKYFTNGVVIIDGNNYPNDKELQDKMLLSFFNGTCKFDINLKELGIKRTNILGNIYFDKSLNSVMFVTTEGIGNYPLEEGELAPKPSIKTYLYNVSTNKAIIKEVPFNKEILADGQKTQFYIISEDKLLNVKEKTIYFTTRYASTMDGCGYDCWESLDELKSLNLKEINSNTGVFAFHYDTGKLNKVYDSVFYNPTDGSLFTGGELSISPINPDKVWFQEKREVHNILSK